MLGKFPGNVQEMSWNSSGNVLDISRKHSGKAPGYVPEMSGNFLGKFTNNFPIMFWSCFRKLIYRTFPKKFLDSAWTFPGISGHFREVYRICSGHFPEHVRKTSAHLLHISRTFPGHILEMSWKCPGHFLEISRSFDGQFLDISRTFPRD